MRRLSVATHGHCFDGLASAAVFTALYRALEPGDVEVRYVGCDYGPGSHRVPDAALDGDDGAILDFRYTPSPKLTWYFDHHATAFATDEDRARFDAGHPRRAHFDPACSSCTKLIADVGRTTYGVDLSRHEVLIGWADVLDAARFASAEDAVARRSAAEQLGVVVERHGDTRLLGELVPLLLERSLDEVRALPHLDALYAPLAAERAASLDLLRAHAVVQGDVVVCDLMGVASTSFEKFGLYALFPDARYTLVAVKNGPHVRLMLGSNPWSSRPRTHHLGDICRARGGGGHPYVGGFAAPEPDAARRAMREVVEELSR